MQASGAAAAGGGTEQLFGLKESRIQKDGAKRKMTGQVRGFGKVGPDSGLAKCIPMRMPSYATYLSVCSASASSFSSRTDAVRAVCKQRGAAGRSSVQHKQQLLATGCRDVWAGAEAGMETVLWAQRLPPF